MAWFLGSGARSVPAFGFERFPALELREQQRLDLRAALLVGAQNIGRLPVVIGSGHFFRELLLLGFESADLARQRFQLAGLLVRKLGPTLFFHGCSLLLRNRFLLHASLPHIVAIAAGVLFPFPVAFRGERLRDDVVQERAVVRNKQDSAGVIL